MRALPLVGFSLPGIVACTLLSPQLACASVTLASAGHTTYSIVTAPDASPTVTQAAQELSADLQQVTGAVYPVITNTPPGPAIFVGPGTSLTAAFPTVNLGVLKTDGFVLRTSGGNVAIAGDEDRGTLFGVYTFLEYSIGMRWFAPDCTVTPHRPDLTIADLDQQVGPVFRYRDVGSYVLSQGGDWGAHLRLNGESLPDLADHGGISRTFDGSQNFYKLVPPSVYFATHPEYYSCLGGQRTAASGSQLCLTNPDVLTIVSNAVIAEAQAHPEQSVFAVAPNDSPDGACQCADCLSSDALYGGPSGTLLHFVNQVADRVKAALPGRAISIETLAYQYTEAPPTAGAITAKPNVVVCFAPIGGDKGHPLATDPANATVLAHFQGWSQIPGIHMHLWDYTTNFTFYLQPFPDWNQIGADLALYASGGVRGVFLEGNYQSRGEFSDMRAWVLAHLLWNPHSNVWSLIQEFCSGYYGPAGKDVYQYLQLFESQLTTPGVDVGIHDWFTSPYLAPGVLTQAGAILDRASTRPVSAVQRDRLGELRLGLRQTLLLQSFPGPLATADEIAAWKLQALAFQTDLGHYQVTYLSEGETTAEVIDDLLAYFG